MWVTASLPDPETPVYLLVVFGLLFLAGWSFSRGANLQKLLFKKDPKRVFLGIRPEILTEGRISILVNGYWGLSRHINYPGEIGMIPSINLRNRYRACVHF